VTTHTPGTRQVPIARQIRPARPRAAAALALALASGALAPAAAVAQDPTRVVTPTGQPCSYDSCALRVEDGWFSRRLVRGPEGTVVARLGIGGPSLAGIVQLSDSAVAHARRYQSAQRTGDVVSLLGTIGSIAALVALDDDTSTGEVVAVNVGAAVVFAIGQGFHIRARRELSRSLWWYNRAVVGTP
jgi:hypothetical protein